MSTDVGLEAFKTNVRDCEWSSSQPCRNGATCFPLATSFLCQCAAGFEGTRCEAEVNECASNPCLNGGTCVDRQGCQMAIAKLLDCMRLAIRADMRPCCPVLSVISAVSKLYTKHRTVRQPICLWARRNMALLRCAA